MQNASSEPSGPAPGGENEVAAPPAGKTRSSSPVGALRSGPHRDPVVPIFYTLLLLLVLFEFPRLGINRTAIYILAGALAIYLARELSVFYTIDNERLNAWRLFGWRRVPLGSIRRIERISLRDLSPTGFVGSWGWRSRLWSPQVGKFDAVYTFHRGLLVMTDDVPVFISPANPKAFAKVLSRRVEAAGGSLDGPEPDLDED